MLVWSYSVLCLSFHNTHLLLLNCFPESDFQTVSTQPLCLGLKGLLILSLFPGMFKSAMKELSSSTGDLDLK